MRHVGGVIAVNRALKGEGNQQIQHWLIQKTKAFLLRRTKDDPKRVLQERNDRRRQRMQNAAKIIYGDKTEAYERHASREGSLHASSRYRIYYEGSLLSMD